jgi:hypothetical protein
VKEIRTEIMTIFARLPYALIKTFFTAMKLILLKIMEYMQSDFVYKKYFDLVFDVMCAGGHGSAGI